jgi:integrase
MARATGRLSALKVSRAVRKPGMYPDGGGLYLQVTPGGASWVYRYMLDGRAREMGLGPLRLYSLQEARAKALDAARLRHEGVDPIEARRAARAAARLDEAKAITFRKCAELYIKSHRAGWRNGKHAAQWASTLATYAEPLIGDLAVQGIDTALIMKVLEQDVKATPKTSPSPLWTARPETATRLRGRMEVILDWARVRGYREGENPARWRGHLDKLLPARDKVRRVRHHAALPYGELPAFMASLREYEGVAARALEFAILTAARTGEVINARWSEIDGSKSLWSIPASRMKSGREHRVPLGPRALAVLDEMKQLAHCGGENDQARACVFPGAKVGRPLSNMAFLMLLRRMGRNGLTAHGFRSSFRDWTAERTNFPAEVAELALAHAVGDKLEAAYRRGDLFEKRRRLMSEWESYCALGSSAPQIISIGRGRV